MITCVTVTYFMCYAVGVGEGHLDVVETKCYGNILNDVTWVQYIC